MPDHKVHPETAPLSSEEVAAKYGEIELAAGAQEFVTMADGWKLQRETWTPTSVPLAVVLYLHGGGESTRTVAVRRLAAACLKRDLILETYDAHGHGNSREKHGVAGNPKWQGTMVDSYGCAERHATEIAELVVAKHKLPLVLMGHSLGATTAMVATDGIITACRKHGVAFATGIYLAPGLGTLQAKTLPCCPLAGAHCCCVGVWALCCCCNHCNQPCCPGEKHDHNPDGLLGPDNIGSHANFSVCLFENRKYPQGNAMVPDAVSRMTQLEDGLMLWGKTPNISGIWPAATLLR